VALACAMPQEPVTPAPAGTPQPAPAAFDLGMPLRYLDVQALPRLEFVPCAPTPGTTMAQQEEWAALVRSTWRDGFGRVQRAAHGSQANFDGRDMDIVDATPAWLNALRGLDLSDAGDLAFASYVLIDWRTRQGQQLKFHWNPDPEAASADDLRRRVLVIDGLLLAWRGKVEDPLALAEYRQQVAERLNERAKAAAEGGR
jgi:hypothetical protein